jgi:hypothetical protein
MNERTKEIEPGREGGSKETELGREGRSKETEKETGTGRQRDDERNRDREMER